MPKREGIKPCALCGARHDDPARALGHLLIAHGPLDAASPRKRKRVRAKLPLLHRRLEEAGFSEVQAHIIIRLVAEEFRKTGIV